MVRCWIKGMKIKEPKRDFNINKDRGTTKGPGSKD